MMNVSFVNKNWLYKMYLVCSIIVAWPDLFFVPFFHTSSVQYGQPVKKIMIIYIDKPSPQKVEEETSFSFACPNLLDFGFFSSTNKKSFFILSKGRWSEQLH